MLKRDHFAIRRHPCFFLFCAWPELSYSLYIKRPPGVLSFRKEGMFYWTLNLSHFGLIPKGHTRVELGFFRLTARCPPRSVASQLGGITISLKLDAPVSEVVQVNAGLGAVREPD